MNDVVISTPTIKLLFSESSSTIAEWFKTFTGITGVTKVVNKSTDNFEYPNLLMLRKEFEATGLYSSNQLDEIIEVYERLPKYRAQRKSASRSKRRS